MRWEKIDTAPKDGSKFLGFMEKEGVGFWRYQDDDGSGRPVGWRDSFIYVYKEGTGPTHWMPVPDAP